MQSLGWLSGWWSNVKVQDGRQALFFAFDIRNISALCNWLTHKSDLDIVSVC